MCRLPPESEDLLRGRGCPSIAEVVDVATITQTASANSWKRVDDIHAVVDGLRARGTKLVGELVRYEDSYWLCYVRDPEGIIVELAEKIG